MSRESNLHRLQEIDNQIENARARIVEIETILSDTSMVSAEQRALTAAEEALRTVQNDNKRAEDNVTTQRAKIERTTKLLYGGTVTNPKELEDRQREAEALGRHLSTLEDELLEAMVALDDAAAAHKQAAEALERAEMNQATQQTMLGRERAELEVRLERLAVEREVASTNIPPDDMRRYKQLRQRVGPIAIAILDDGSCSACGLGIPPSKMQAVRRQDELVPCSQCGRILYAK